MGKSVLVLCLSATLLFAISAQGATVVEKFKPNSPLIKVEQWNSVSNFYYNAEGYVTAVLARKQDPNTLAMYYVPLDTKVYMPNSTGQYTANELWLGFDFRYETGGGVTGGSIGLFNSDSNNIPSYSSKINSIGIAPYNGNKFTIRSEANNGSGVLDVFSHSSSIILTGGESYRFKMRVYVDGAATKTDVGVYTVGSSGAASLVGSETGVMIASGNKFLYGLNALGIRNTYGTDSNTNASNFSVDNMYVSTDSVQTDANLGAPGWLVQDDPASLVVADEIDIKTKFYPDPNWPRYAQQWSGSSMAYDANGMLYCNMRRKADNDSVAACYKPLGTRIYMPFNYNGLAFNSVNEFWMGFDLKPTYGTVATYHVGLFNNQSNNYFANGNNTKTNSIAVSNSGGTIVMRVSWNTKSNAAIYAEPVVGVIPGYALLKTYRVACRVYADQVTFGKTYGDVSVYEFDAAGVLNPTAVLTNNGLLLLDNTAATSLDKKMFFDGMDSFGVRNNNHSSNTSSIVRFYLDNMYFSTTGPTTFAAPSWFCLNPADFNCDKAVNLLDFKTLVDTWLSTSDMTAELVGNGKVDMADFAKFGSFWIGN